MIVMPLLSSGSYPQHSPILLVIRSTRALDIYTHNFTSSVILMLDKPAHTGKLWKNNPTGSQRGKGEKEGRCMSDQSINQTGWLKC